MAKAQYYIFGAIVFISAIFVIYTSGSGMAIKSMSAIEDFKSNYLFEGHNVINSAIYHGSNVSEAMRNFTVDYLDYAASSNENIALAFIYSKEGKLYINNYLEEPIVIDDSDILAPTQELQIEYEESVKIRYANDTYYQTFGVPEKTELRVFMVETQ
jgi:hypothetical protein